MSKWGLFSKKRYILREKLSERRNERRFVMLELEIQAGRISICGTEGYSLSLRDARHEEKQLNHDQVLLRKRRVYFVEGIGQICEQIVQFFPEMKPHMSRHLERFEDDDAEWFNRKFSRSKELTRTELEQGWS